MGKYLIFGLIAVIATGVLLWAKDVPNSAHPTDTSGTIISAHRGGRNMPGFPENALETFDFTRSQVPNAWIECDISQSQDSVLFLLHDASLDRTSTGTGQVNRLNWAVIDTCHLVDDFQQISPWKIPTLAEALDWARQKGATLSLDVKRGVPFEKVLRQVEAEELVDQCIIIVYSAENALKVHQLNPRVRISSNIRNEEELQRHLQLSIPSEQLMAFVGTRLPSPSHFDRLQEFGIPAILGSLGNLDQRAEARGDHLYCEWGRQVKVIATDRPVAAYQALQHCELSSINSK